MEDKRPRPEVKPLTEGHEKIYFKKDPPSNKTTPPPPKPNTMKVEKIPGASKEEIESIENLAKYFIRDVPDFPKKGVLFKDISPLLKEPVFLFLIKKLALRFANWKTIDYVAGIEARGFPVGMALSYELRVPFLMIRKADKLPPGDKSVVSYETEYSGDKLEVYKGKGRIIIVDDLLATGGTMKAAFELCIDAGYSPVGLITLINLKYLNDKKNEITFLKTYSEINYKTPKS